MTPSKPPHGLLWDWPLRLFHVLFALSMIAALTTGLSGNFDWMEWHPYLGYVILALLIFRLQLGLFGSFYGRFRALPLHPRSVLAYLKGEHQQPGHNPVGSWMVVTLLISALLQVISGFGSSDDILLEGPWHRRLSDDWQSIAGQVHEWNGYLLLGLCITHVSVIVLYRLRGINLVAAMLHGRGEGATAQPQGLGSIVISLALSALLSWGLITWI